MNAPRLFIFGDSHATTIARGAKMLGVPYVGGNVMKRSDWDRGAFSLCEDGRLELAGEGEAALARLLDAAGARSLFELRIPIVTTVVFAPLRMVKRMAGLFDADPAGEKAAFLSSAFVRRMMLARRPELLDLAERLQGPGRPVLLVAPPARTRPPALAAAAERAIAEEAERRGLAVHHTRPWSAGADGLLMSRYASELDNTHANALYGAEILFRTAPLLGFDEAHRTQMAERLGERRRVIEGKRSR